MLTGEREAGASLQVVEPPLVIREALRAPTVSVDASWRLARLVGDAAMLGAAIAVAVLLTDGAPTRTSVGTTVAFALLSAVVFATRGAYSPRLRIDILDDLRTVVVATAFAAMVVISARALIDPSNAGAYGIVTLWLLAAVYVGAGRVALDLSHAAARARGNALRPTIIVGAGRVGRLVAQRLIESPRLGLKPVGFLDKDPLLLVDDEQLPVPVLGASWDLESVVAEHDVRQVVITFSRAPHDVLLRLVRRCEELGVALAFVPQLFERTTDRVPMEHLGGLPLLGVSTVDPKGASFRVKHTIDRVVAAVALVILLPVFAAAAAAVRLSLGRPVFFRQLRVGRDDNPFWMLKFRTLLNPEPGQESEAADDARRTVIGEFLRRTSIDELPQLFNVLRGEMSLVGPRPERPELVRLFESRVYRYSDRHRVKAGITGWAQIHGLGRGPDRFGDASLRERVEWDNWYIENWSLWLDVKILVFTLLAVLRFRQSV